MKTSKKLRAILSSFDARDIPPALLIFGIALVGYGASQLHDGLGPLIVGGLLILYVQPLKRWFG